MAASWEAIQCVLVPQLAAGSLFGTEPAVEIPLRPVGPSSRTSSG